MARADTFLGFPLPDATDDEWLERALAELADRAARDPERVKKALRSRPKTPMDVAVMAVLIVAAYRYDLPVELPPGEPEPLTDAHVAALLRWFFDRREAVWREIWEEEEEDDDPSETLRFPIQ